MEPVKHDPGWQRHGSDPAPANHPRNESQATALVIDGEPQNRRLLQLILETNGFRFMEAANGKDGLVQVAQRSPAVILLDLDLPDMDGLLVLQRLREWSNVPVLVVSARNWEQDKIAALDYGADDYITKPIAIGELLARLRAIQRHAPPSPTTSVLRLGKLEIDLSARVVKFMGREVKLTVTEYAMLKFFAQHAGKVLTHRQILNAVWGPNCVGHTNYLRVYIAHLREKFEMNPVQPTLFLTEPGVGYQLVETT